MARSLRRSPERTLGARVGYRIDRFLFAPSSPVSTLAPPPVHALGHAALGEASAEPVAFVNPTRMSVAPWGRLEDGELFARARYVAWAEWW